MPYNSDIELYFSWYLDDLKNYGVIKRYLYESNTFPLSESKWYEYTKKMVTKSKIIKNQLLEPHVYTPDFLVEWNEDYDGLIYRQIDLHTYTTKPPYFCIVSNKSKALYTFFEVKPSFDRNNMTRLFRITQKWLYDKHHLYVELVLLPDLFKKTFTPKRYLLTDMTLKPRSINWGIISVEEYINKLRGNKLKHE